MSPRKNKVVTSKKVIAETCEELMALNRGYISRQRARIRNNNQLVHEVANSLGYFSGLEEKDREKKFKKARQYIERVQDEEDGGDGLIVDSFIRDMGAAHEVLLSGEELIGKEIENTAKQLHVSKWVKNNVCGVGMLLLGRVIGETGDLFNYDGPAKVWKRMGVAPWQRNGDCKMPTTWMKNVPKTEKPSADEWSEFGYCPRRRSLMFVVGDMFGRSRNKDNGDRYVQRFNKAKEDGLKKWPDDPKMHAELHAKLLSSKLFLKDLFLQWWILMGEDPPSSEYKG